MSFYYTEFSHSLYSAVSASSSVVTGCTGIDLLEMQRYTNTVHVMVIPQYT